MSVKSSYRMTGEDPRSCSYVLVVGERDRNCQVGMELDISTQGSHFHHTLKEDQEEDDEATEGPSEPNQGFDDDDEDDDDSPSGARPASGGASFGPSIDLARGLEPPPSTPKEDPPPSSIIEKTTTHLARHIDKGKGILTSSNDNSASEIEKLTRRDKMKGRARPPSSPESEESWTVDCPCGVNYDDGEEMVDCDECGVWVHTGCCRILKGHTSYVCDKCKFKKNKESEESEVAQLLVELPSKTPPLEEKVFTLRSELSREERAHVQGIPGGDPSFFVGVSPVFSRQLWEYSGYVPKVFQFNYNDLPQEKAGARVLFAEYAETRAEDSILDFASGEHQDGKLVNTDIHPLGEAHAENNYFSWEKHNKRESRKEAKYRLREQQEDFIKNHYHSKRRRDANSKRDFTSKKRSKSFGADDYQSAPRRSYDETTIPLKSARIASRNLKSYSIYNSVEDADAYPATKFNNNTKVEELGPQSFGFNSREAGIASDGSFRKHLATKAARKVAPVSCGRSEQEECKGICRALENSSVQEMHDIRKEQEPFARTKLCANKSDGDVSKLKDDFGSSGQIEVKAVSAGHAHISLANAKEISPRARSSFILNTKEQLDETLLEQSPSPISGKIDMKSESVGYFLGYLQQRGARKLGKQHRSNDDDNVAARQQYLSRKQAEHNSSANSSDDDDRPLSIRFTNESHAADLPHTGTNQPNNQLSGDDLPRANDQDLAPLHSPSSRQDADEASLISIKVLKAAVQNLHEVVDDSIKASPSSIQTGPSQLADLSSPTLSGPGVDSKQLGFMKMDSASPPSERTQNVGVSQPIPSFKTYVGSPIVSNNKSYSSVVSKGGSSLSNPHVNSNSTSYLRSKTNDTKKADGMSGDLNEESTSLSLENDPKELSKVAGSGKCAAVRGTSHLKAPKQSGQLLDSGAQVNQSLPQNRHSLKSLATSLPHKAEKPGLAAGSKSTTVLLSPSHASTVDVQMQGMDCMRPVLNDEELALLLHQELNSSPRVPRVARVRQGGAGAHPFSTKRSAMAITPVTSNATQKDPHLIYRRKNKDESHGEVAHESESPGVSAKQGAGMVTHGGSGGVIDRQPQSDSFGDMDDRDRKMSADNILTLPGLIEDILNEKGSNASYDLICEEVLPHWSKLRKHNGERYAYTSHRQAVLDCLRNRSAWSHLIDRGPKTNLGRKRRRLESAVASESEHAEQSSHLHDGCEELSLKALKESEVDPSETWPLSDSNKEADLSLPEEVPKGKRKARRGRRLTPQSRGHGTRAHNGRSERLGEFAQGTDDDFDHMVSPFSEEPASSSEDEEIYIHRGAGRHISRHRGSSVDSEDDEVDL
ncbi:hypothetical protein L7F22_044881 [Adiantum nelumboides]|nr:hypothetical protein [Adiantum nelumboides]